MSGKYTPEKLAFAKRLRNHQTREENFLWHEYLRHSQHRFRRQAVLFGYIADFYSPRLGLVIEIDGGQHYLEEDQVYDEKRTAVLEKNGLKVHRIDNLAVSRHFDYVLKEIEQVIEDMLMKS